MLLQDFYSLISKRVNFDTPGVRMEMFDGADGVGEGDNIKDCFGEKSNLFNYGGFAIHTPNEKSEVTYFGEFLNDMERNRWLDKVVNRPKEYGVYMNRIRNLDYDDPYLVTGYSAFPDPKMLFRETDTHFIQYYATSDHLVVWTVHEKTERGYERVSPSVFVDSGIKVCCRGDIYKNPSNKHAWDDWTFVEPKEKVYWGQDIYFNPHCPSLILLRMGDKWVWTNRISFEENIPAQYLDEYALFKNFIE